MMPLQSTQLPTVQFGQALSVKTCLKVLAKHAGANIQQETRHIGVYINDRRIGGLSRGLKNKDPLPNYFLQQLAEFFNLKQPAVRKFIQDPKHHPLPRNWAA